MGASDSRIRPRLTACSPSFHRRVAFFRPLTVGLLPFMALVDDFEPDLIGLNRLLLVGPRVGDQLGLDLQRRSNAPGFCDRGHCVQRP